VPAEGVYAGRASTGVPTSGVASTSRVASTDGALAGSGESWPAAINIGPNPTFDEYGQKVEVHLVGCDRPLYGEALEVDFLARLRDIQPFAGVDALRDQLARDVDRTRYIVRDAAVPQ
jgi:riboflavin kinase/FMN adenylyltransferase